MSRFDIDKFMYHVDADTDLLAAFCADRAGFVDAWVQRDLDHHGPVLHGGPLDDHERRALIDLDYGALYAMGGHPYILLHFARAVEVDIGKTPFPEFDAAYKAAVAPHGYPNFAT